MNSPFALIVPGYPMITQFEQVENTRFITSLPNPSSISELCFTVSSGVNFPTCGIALYYSFDQSQSWIILGTVTTNAPSGIFRTGWSTLNVENCPCVYIGVSLEDGDFVSNLNGIIQSPFQREVPVMKVAEDLYNFMSSYGSRDNEKLILPSDILDKWIEKTKRKLLLDPRYFY